MQIEQHDIIQTSKLQTSNFLLKKNTIITDYTIYFQTF